MRETVSIPGFHTDYYSGTARYYREQLGKDIELEMVLVKGDRFIMGSPETEEEHWL